MSRNSLRDHQSLSNIAISYIQHHCLMCGIMCTATIKTFGYIYHAFQAIVGASFSNRLRLYAWKTELGWRITTMDPISVDRKWIKRIILVDNSIKGDVPSGHHVNSSTGVNTVESMDMVYTTVVSSRQIKLMGFLTRQWRLNMGEVLTQFYQHLSKKRTGTPPMPTHRLNVQE